MNKKQLGAAAGNETKSQSGERPGLFGRLRNQPGFRAAAIAFVLTVALGIGSTVAYAYWSKQTGVTISGQTLQPSTPIPTNIRCQPAFVNRIVWPETPGMDPEARYIVTFESGLLDQPISYALPSGALGVEPFNLDLKASLGYSFREQPLTVTLRTALLKSPSTATVRVSPSNLLFQSEPSAPVMMGYQNLGIAGFPCRS